MKLLGGLLLAGSLLLAGPALAQSDVERQRQQQLVQPGNNAPVWRDVRAGEAHATTDRGREAGVLVHPLSWHRVRPGVPGFVIGYAAHPPGRLRDAARRIAAIVEPLRS